MVMVIFCRMGAKKKKKKQTRVSVTEREAVLFSMRISSTFLGQSPFDV